jgi:hypothetical protein
MPNTNATKTGTAPDPAYFPGDNNNIVQLLSMMKLELMIIEHLASKQVLSS